MSSPLPSAHPPFDGLLKTSLNGNGIHTHGIAASLKSSASFSASSETVHNSSASIASSTTLMSASSYESGGQVSTSISLSEEQKRILYMGTRSLGASLSQVPWMKFRVIAEPNMDLFASDIRLRSFISEVTKLTVSMVTKECSEEIAVLVTTLMASLSNSMTTRVSLLQETIIEQIAALKLADTMTGCHTLHGIEDRFCVGPIRQREPIHTPVESPKHVQGEHDHGTHGLSLYLHDHHLDISKANWIWTNEAAHRKPGHPLLARPFRKVIKTEWAVNRLSITMACDNRYTLYVNGHLVGSGEVWKTPDRYTVEFEATTEVVVAVYAASEDITGTAVGLIACGKVWNTHEQHAREILFVSDGSWKTHSSSNLEKTFFHAHFKDSTWEQAYVVATYGGAAWSSEMKGAHKGKLVHKRWTGRSNIPDAPESPKAKVIA